MKTVFITGATSGIGQEMAREYHAAGWRVLFCGRREDRLREFESELETISAGRAKGFLIDVVKESDFAVVGEYLTQAGGSLDLIIANAGFGVAGKFERLAHADYVRQFDTNVYGVMNSFRPFISEIKKSRGQFVIIGSGNGYISLGGSSPYCMSKFAVRAFSDALGFEMRKYGVAVTLVCPGFVESEIRHVNNRGELVADSADPVPKWIQVPAKKAAREAIRGIAKRKAEVWVTGHVKLFILLELLLPGVSRWVKARVIPV